MDLPLEILEFIAINLSFIDLTQICQVNSIFHSIWQNDHFWYSKTIHDFGKCSKEHETWYKQYIFLYFYNFNISYALHQKDKNLIRRMMEYPHKITCVEKGLQGAVLLGKIDLVELFISKGANDWFSAMIETTYEKNKEIIDYFKSKHGNMFKFNSKKSKEPIIITLKFD